MDLEAFNYHLPKHLIAQEPLKDRAASRLLAVSRSGPGLRHAFFRELPDLLAPDDVLVVNRSRVMPARLFAARVTGGKVELFVTKIQSTEEFTAIANPLRKLRPGDILVGEGEKFRFEVIGRLGEREVTVRVVGGESVSRVLEKYGHVPLPPYIQRPDASDDRARYQTVYANESGSVAAPTAGLHFTNDLLSQLQARGVDVYSILLHVGLGTFLPLEHDRVEENKLHGEEYSIDGGTMVALAEAKRSGKKIVAVGTTTTRVLETLHRDGMFGGEGRAIHGATDLFIYPGIEFGFIDGLITNFHLPQSSLFMLVCAFLGREKALASYEEAIRKEYRFYSYGDAMLIR